MLTEISLNVLDIAQNSITAEASLVQIAIKIDQKKDLFELSIEDNGFGMDEESLSKVCDPFYTTRTTRKVGFGISFLKLESELTGGEFNIESSKGKGTKVYATFGLSHIDRMPLGDICESIHSLVVYNSNVDFVFNYSFNDNSFTMDTREFRETLGDVPFDVPEISSFIKDFLYENKAEVDGGANI